MIVGAIGCAVAMGGCKKDVKPGEDSIYINKPTKVDKSGKNSIYAKPKAPDEKPVFTDEPVVKDTPTGMTAEKPAIDPIQAIILPKGNYLIKIKERSFKYHQSNSSYCTLDTIGKSTIRWFWDDNCNNQIDSLNFHNATRLERKELIKMGKAKGLDAMLIEARKQAKIQYYPKYLEKKRIEEEKARKELEKKKKEQERQKKEQIKIKKELNELVP